MYLGMRCAPHPTGCLPCIFPSGTCVYPVQQIHFMYFHMPSSTYYIYSCPAHSTSETLSKSVLSQSSCQARGTSHVNYGNSCLSGLLFHSYILKVFPPHSIADRWFSPNTHQILFLPCSEPFNCSLNKL